GVGMVSFLVPHLRLGSVLELKPPLLRERGLDGLFFDLDNTLLECRAARLSRAVEAWLLDLRSAGVRLCAVTNAGPARASALLGPLGIPFVTRAHKPLPFGCRRAMRHLKLTPPRTAMVGDQVFADVLAGRLAGLFTILVPPLSAAEPWFTR